MSNDNVRSLAMFGVPNMAETAKALTETAEERNIKPTAMLASQLSDVQELLEMGRNDEARQAINRVKYMLGYWETSPPKMKEV